MTENKRKKNNGSAILRGINKFALWIERKIKSGFVGKILGSYTKENQALSKSFTASVLNRRTKCGDFLTKIRFAVSDQFEDSKILFMLRKFVGFFLGCRLRFYGTLFMTFGVYVGLIYFLKYFFFPTEVPSLSFLVTAVVLMVSAVPLLLSRQTFASKLITSRSGHFIVFDVLGISEEKMSVPYSRYSEVYNIAIFSGIVFGTLSYFVHPLYILSALGAVIGAALILSHPEVGVLAAVTLLPFLSQEKNQNMLNVIIILYCFGYLVKLIRGKRILNFEIIDLFMLFFAAIIVISGSVGAELKAGVLVVLVLGAFVAGNLMRTKLWQKRCAVAVVFSGTLSAMITVLSKVASFSDFLLLSDALNNIAFFDQRNILSAYLTVTLLLVCSGFSYSDNSKKKIILYSSALINIAAIVLLNTLSAWIGALIALLIFFFIKTKKTFTVIVSAGVASPCVLLYTYGFLPDRIKNVFDITSSGIYSTFKIWQGAMQLVIASAFGGVGIGGFDALYPQYAVAGFEWAESAGSLWLSILSKMGIIGLLLFIGVLFLYIQNCFEYMANGGSKENLFVVAGFAAVIGVTAMSMFCDLFVSQSFFYAFFCSITVVCAAIRSERTEEEKRRDVQINSEVSASVSL